MGCQKIDLVLYNVHWTLIRGEKESRELPVDLKEKHSKTVVFCLAKSFTKRLETSKFHDAKIFFTFVNNFQWCLYSCDNQIAHISFMVSQ